MDPGERLKIVAEFARELERLIDELNLDPYQIFNADQTSLFYSKIPNMIYGDKEAKKNLAGVKAMKSKDRITIMVCVSASGEKVPLFVVGKPKEPTCFRLLEGKSAPLPYCGQAKAWFDKRVSLHWIHKVFWPWWIRHHGEKHCILIYDNFSAQKFSDEELAMLPEKLHILHLPPNVTSNHQPCDMGIIASLKVGYKAGLLRKLLSVFENPNGFAAVVARRKQAARGCKGLDEGGKAHILDAMKILVEVWSRDDKYATPEGIMRCWRKTNILPARWNADFNNDVGSKSRPVDEQRINPALHDELCALMGDLSVKVKESGASTDYIFQDTFAASGDINQDFIRTMVDNWIEIEDTREIVDCEIDEDIQRILRNEPENDDDDDSEEEIEDAQVHAPRLEHKQAKEMAQSLLMYAEQNSYDENLTRGLRKFAKEIEKRRLNQTRSQSSLKNFFRPQPKQPPK